jgi:N-acetylneuraminate synthase
MSNPSQITLSNATLNQAGPLYFIADIAANHDGKLSKALDLIKLAADSGAHAAKFQHFHADTIVSDLGFRELGGMAHQAKWTKTVREVYLDASIDLSWTEKLAECCSNVGIEFMSTPYSPALVEHLDPFVSAYKIGSGDITYTQNLEAIAATGKPWMLATGASELEDVERAVKILSQGNSNGVLMQCNTNYTGESQNLRHLNISAISQFSELFPDLILGLSDHTHGDVSILVSIALGARVFEKHFTDSVNHPGPDHAFSMDPSTWSQMVRRAEEAFSTLGDGQKKIESNEKDSVIVQRRAIRARRDLSPGHLLTYEDFDYLRPCSYGELAPYEASKLVGQVLNEGLTRGQAITWQTLK